MYKDILISEYANFFIKEDGTVWNHINNKLTKYPLPEPVTTGSAGHPYANVIGESGKVYHLKNNAPTVTPVPIGNAASSTAFYTHHVILSKEGGITVYKDDLKSVNLKTPGKIVKAIAAADLLVMDEFGGIWKYEWISSGKIVKSHSDLAKQMPEVIQMDTATDIATSRSMFSAAIVNGKLIVWCDAFGAPFIGQKKPTSPFKPDWAVNRLDKPLKKVYTTDNCLYIIDGNDELWGMGNNWVGQVGNGQIDPRVLAGNADMGNRTFVSEPVNISRGRKWKRVFVGTYYAFRTFFEDMLGNIYVCGYGKFGLHAHGIRPQDDPTNVGITAITKPHRVTIPPTLTVVSTDDLKSGKVAYPPKEPRTLIKTTTTRYYDDGTQETETV